MIPPGGQVLPLRIAALVLVPVVLVTVTLAYGGWSGWVPVVAALAVLGTFAVVVPKGRVWVGVATLISGLADRPPTWLVRTGPWWGAGMLLVAGILAMAGVEPV